MLMADPLMAPLTKALAPKITSRPALNETVPKVDAIVLLTVISPNAVADVRDTLPAALMAAATTIPLPEFNPMVLKAALTAALTVKSPTAVVDVNETATLPVMAAPTTKALPATRVIVPKVEVIVPLPLLIKSALVTDAVAVRDIFIPALIAALIDKLRPDNKVTVPNAELTAAPMVMSPTAPTDVKLTLPNPAALTAPVTPNVDEVAAVAKVILPVPVVVTPLVVKLPVWAVNWKFTPVNAAATSVDVKLLVIV